METRVILEGRYRIMRCLAQRPRLNLYIGYRLAVDNQLSSFLNDLPDQDEQGYEPLVAIRELVLTGLPAQMRMLIEAAAFEEFVAPSVFGSSHLPTKGDRVWIEGERHYLVMQLSDAKMPEYDSAMPLDMLLLASSLWPEWIGYNLTSLGNTTLSHGCTSASSRRRTRYPDACDYSCEWRRKGRMVANPASLLASCPLILEDDKHQRPTYICSCVSYSRKAYRKCVCRTRNATWSCRRTFRCLFTRCYSVSAIDALRARCANKKTVRSGCCG